MKFLLILISFLSLCACSSPESRRFWFGDGNERNVNNEEDAEERYKSKHCITAGAMATDPRCGQAHQKVDVYLQDH